MAVWTLFSQGATGSSIASDPTTYTLGIEFSVTQSGCTLTGIWFYSATGAGQLPQTIALYQVTGTSLVHSESAAWSGAAGSGWVRSPFTAPPSLTSSTSYKACVLTSSTSTNWYSATNSYWSSGAGGSGLTSGPISAPNNASSSPGQDSYHQANTIAYPDTVGTAPNYWIDPEITTTTGGAPPVFAPAPGSTWLRRFRHRQIQAAPPSAPVLAANAGLATGTGIAQGGAAPAPSGGNFVPGRAIPGQAIPGRPNVTNLTVLLVPPLGSPPPAVSAPGRTWLRRFRRPQAPQPPRGAVTAGAAGAAPGTAVSFAPAVTITVPGGQCAGAGAALAPVPAVTANAGLATGTGAALGPTVSTSSSTNAPAGLATGTGAALAPTVAVTANAGLATGTGAALAPGTAPAANAQLATAAAAALPPVPAVTANAQLAAATAAGLAPTVTTSGSTTANAGLATGTGAALAPGHGTIAGLAPATAAATAMSLAAAANASAAAALAGALNVPPQFVVARSSGNTVADPRDGTKTVTAVATSSPGVT